MDSNFRGFTPQYIQQAHWAARAHFFSLGVIAGFYGVHIPSIKAHYALSEGFLSVVLLAVALGSVLTLIVAGRVVGTIGTKRTIQFNAVLMGGLIALALHWPTLPLLLISMALMGSAMSLFDVAINTEGSTLESVCNRPIMGNLHGSFSLGGMGGSMLAGILINAGRSPSEQLALVGMGVAFWVALTALNMMPTHPPHRDHSTVSKRSFQWPSRVLVIMGILAFSGMSAEGAMYDWTVLYLHQELAMQQAHAAWGYAIFSGSMAAARFGGDSLRARFPEHLLLRAGGTISATAMALVLISGHPVVAFLGLGLIGAGLSMVVPIIYNAASRLQGHSRASSIAAVSAFGYSGFLLGPPVIGSVAQLTNLSWAMSLVVLLAALLAWGSRYMPTA